MVVNLRVVYTVLLQVVSFKCVKRSSLVTKNLSD
jgi:hypothetical protein